MTDPAAVAAAGEALLAAGDAAGAIAVFQRAMAADPENRRAYVLGATEVYRRTLTLDRDHALAHSNLGLAFAEYGAFETEIACHRQALALDPDLADAHFCLGMALLRQGDFAAGWHHYEGRRRLPDWGGPAFRAITAPLWEGEDLKGRSILLQAEQGLGDTIQFLRYAPLLAARGAQVTVRLPPVLVRLARTLAGGIAVAGNDAVPPPTDFHLPLLSLPLRLGTTLDTIPPAVPYLGSTATAATGGRPRRIGLVWAGAPGHKRDRRRSIALATFAPLARATGIDLVSLQIGPRAVEALAPPGGLTLRNALWDSADFADTAAVVAGLDLVITVDTALAHLAGALGKPVWILLPYAADWRWLLDREDSPWYPSAHLFRQEEPDAWAAVLERVAAALARSTD